MSETSDLVAETVSNLAQVEEFFPRRFLRNGHLQTLVGNFKPRQYVLPEPEAHLIEVDAEKGASPRTASLPVSRHQSGCSRRRPKSVRAEQAMCFAIAIGRRMPANALR